MTVNRILVVEDHDTLRQMLSLYLVSNGYHVIEAADGRQAMDAAARERPGLIMMDIQLPHVSGLEATRAIKGDPALARIPIVAITGLAMDEEQARCLEAGCDHVIIKPYELKDVLALVRRLLG